MYTVYTLSPCHTLTTYTISPMKITFQTKSLVDSSEGCYLSGKIVKFARDHVFNERFFPISLRSFLIRHRSCRIPFHFDTLRPRRTAHHVPPFSHVFNELNFLPIQCTHIESRRNEFPACSKS